MKEDATPEAAETKPEEQKPEETKPEETKPEEQKPEETKPEEQKPEETKPEDTTLLEAPSLKQKLVAKAARLWGWVGWPKKKLVSVVSHSPHIKCSVRGFRGDFRKTAMRMAAECEGDLVIKAVSKTQLDIYRGQELLVSIVEAT